MGSSYLGHESLHGVVGSNLDFSLISFVQVIVHSTGQTDRPNLGGAPSPFPTVGNSKPYPSIRSYPVQPTAFYGVIHSWIGKAQPIHTLINLCC